MQRVNTQRTAISPRGGFTAVPAIRAAFRYLGAFHHARCSGLVLVLSTWISRTLDSGRAVQRDGREGRSPATDLPVGRNSTVIPNNYLQLGREARRILAYERERCIRVAAPVRRWSAGTWSCERNPPEFRLQGGPSSLEIARSRTDTYTRPSARNHPLRSPSFRRMTFRLSSRAHPRRSPPLAGALMPPPNSHSVALRVHRNSGSARNRDSMIVAWE